MLNKMYLASATGYIVLAYLTPNELQANDLDGLHVSVVAEIFTLQKIL